MEMLLSFSNYEVKGLYFPKIGCLKIHPLIRVSYENTERRLEKEDWRKKTTKKQLSMSNYWSLTKFKMIRSPRIMPQKNTGMSTLNEIKKRKKHIEELKFVKNFQ